MPKVGERRVYPGPELPVLYPGEVAHGMGAIDPETGLGEAAEWLVEPAPGWYARWLRLRYRLFGRWAKGKPELEVEVGYEVPPELREMFERHQQRMRELHAKFVRTTAMFYFFMAALIVLVFTIGSRNPIWSITMLAFHLFILHLMMDNPIQKELPDIPWPKGYQRQHLIFYYASKPVFLGVVGLTIWDVIDFTHELGKMLVVKP